MRYADYSCAASTTVAASTTFAAAAQQTAGTAVATGTDDGHHASRDTVDLIVGQLVGLGVRHLLITCTVIRSTLLSHGYSRV
jgi:hypothetical protein